jgi:poly(hydroxyalkanoate) depolymerase family esterase
MTGLGKTLANLARLRRRWDKLLASAQQAGVTDSGPARQQEHLQEVASFGSNPGNLRMLVYTPDALPSDPALVVALHGCTQTAAVYDHGTGWSTLADRFGFVVVYPEQQRSNNPQGCFSWFLPDDTARGRGEALSIRQMVERAIIDYGIDRRRVFVTGLSAGGAMSSVMLAAYPEVFAGGAIIAGLPYGCAASVQEAYDCMLQGSAASARALGDRIRAASRHNGPWPKISVWHGSEDPIVTPTNADGILRQWINVHGLSVHPTLEDVVDGYSRRRWKNAGETVIEAFSITGMAHGVPLATGAGAQSCGAAGAFLLDVGISSTYHIARFFGLADERQAKDERAEAWSTTTDVVAATASSRQPAPEIAVLTDARSSSWRSGHVHEANPPPGTAQPIDPSSVIAAAFKAAGLPIPEFENPTHGRTHPVDPGPIIKAALKAAGLLRR